MRLLVVHGGLVIARYRHRSGRAALADVLAHPDGITPNAAEGLAVPFILFFAQVVPPLVAGLSAEFLRPGRQKAAASAYFKQDVLIR